MRKIAIVSFLALCSTANATDTIIPGSPMDIIQAPANLEDLGREVASINPALAKAFAAIMTDDNSLVMQE